MATNGIENGVIVDWKAYFFSIIGREPGQPAADWRDVLAASTIPAGPPQGVKFGADAPFAGLSQQLGAGGPRARIFVPTDTPDDNGFYTHAIDVVDSDRGVWQWNDHLGGPPFAVRPAPGGSQPAPEQPPQPPEPIPAPLLVQIAETFAHLVDAIDALADATIKQTETIDKLEKHIARVFPI